MLREFLCVSVAFDVCGKKTVKFVFVLNAARIYMHGDPVEEKLKGVNSSLPFSLLAQAFLLVFIELSGIYVWLVYCIM